MTDKEKLTDQEKLHNLNEDCTEFLTKLKLTYSVEESVFALLVPVTKGAELRVRVNGDSAGIVNMLSAAVQQLLPPDFDILLSAMLYDPVFSMQRDPTPIDKRHVN